MGGCGHYLGQWTLLVTVAAVIGTYIDGGNYYLLLTAAREHYYLHYQRELLLRLWIMNIYIYVRI